MKAKVKIGITYGNGNTPVCSMKNPDKGNPGVGGTEFCIGLLIYYLSKTQEFDISVYSFNETEFPLEVTTKVIQSYKDAVKIAVQDKIDILICIQSNDKDFYKFLIGKKIKVIMWVHNHLTYEQANMIANCKEIKRVIFVGRQLYDLYIDQPIIEKADYIFNMFKGDLEEYGRSENYESIVTYMGCLTRVKGFHILARQWKRILKQCPEAQLYVIGGIKLYGESEKLGKYGLAEQAYEEEFINYLLNQDGEIMDSVHFCGVLGQEKYEIFNRTAVGIINPSAYTETFGLSAIEMEACGIPIVTKASQGLLDTTLHKKTGLLFNSEYGFRKNIIKLLKNKKLNKQYGENAVAFVNENFSPEKIIPLWIENIFNVAQGVDADYKEPRNFYFKQGKWARIINRKIQKRIKNWPSIMEMKQNIRIKRIG